MTIQRMKWSAITADSAAAPERRNSRECRGFGGMELAGLEPATSWVRCSGAAPQKWRVCSAFAGTPFAVSASDTGRYGTIRGIQALEASQCLDAGGSETIVLEPPSRQKTYRPRDRSRFDRWGPLSHSACGPRRASIGSSPRPSASM